MADVRENVLSGRLESGALSGALSTPTSGTLSATLTTPKTTVIVQGDYDRLDNKPQINGVELGGNKTSQDLFIVSENTTAGWNSDPLYLPKSGEICIYTDHATVQDDLGNTIVCPGIKVGDGNSYLIDMPFVGTEIRYEILRRLKLHEENTAIHLMPGEREFWNNKLNYDVSNEELILNRN